MNHREKPRLRILLFDSTSYYPSNPLFLEALETLQQENPHVYPAAFVDAAKFARPRSLSNRVAWRLFGRPPSDERALSRELLTKAREFHPDLILITKGSAIRPETLEALKGDTGAILANYATDDPFNGLPYTENIVRSIPLFDLYLCPRRAIIDDIRRAGCPHVLFVPFGYKPTVHFPETPGDEEERARFASDVVFIGGCDSDRVPFFTALTQAIPDLKLKLYGGYWNRVPGLRRYWGGPVWGRNYRLAMGGAKIAINLVRRLNRDGHVMRTFEIPACGAFALNERTQEHLDLFTEGREMACFGSVEELIEKVLYYLPREDERQVIAEAGRRRVGESHTYGDRLVEILQHARALRQAQQDDTVELGSTSPHV